MFGVNNFSEYIDEEVNNMVWHLETYSDDFEGSFELILKSNGEGIWVTNFQSDLELIDFNFKVIENYEKELIFKLEILQYLFYNSQVFSHEFHNAKMFLKEVMLDLVQNYFAEILDFEEKIIDLTDYQNLIDKINFNLREKLSSTLEFKPKIATLLMDNGYSKIGDYYYKPEEIGITHNRLISIDLNKFKGFDNSEFNKVSFKCEALDGFGVGKNETGHFITLFQGNEELLNIPLDNKKHLLVVEELLNSWI